MSYPNSTNSTNSTNSVGRLLTIGVKYCGGCNPEYDRVALAEEMAGTLVSCACFFPAGAEGADLILAIHGCSTACADLSAFGGRSVVNVRTRDEGLRWAGTMAQGMRVEEIMKCVDISDP